MPTESIQISQTDLDNLTEAIRNAPIPVPVAGAEGLESLDARKLFCDNWQTAKEALDVLKTVLNFVPGAGVFAGPAIAVVTAAGNAASSALCGKT